ncbi:MAG: hypothetical protein ACLUNZ_13090 [Evtepia sp.]
MVSLYKFLEEIQAPEALEARSAALLERGEPELAREYSQLWEIFCGALEQCVAMVGEMESSLSDFSRLLRLLLSRYRGYDPAPRWIVSRRAMPSAWVEEPVK